MNKKELLRELDNIIEIGIKEILNVSPASRRAKMDRILDAWYELQSDILEGEDNGA
ncbi:MAG: hypothetical protein WC476_00800 [Phycisphaerae bacterium]|jgi:hypothetical protein